MQLIARDSQNSVIALQRLTTEYVDAEDRICLTGEIEAADTVVVWLTRRLLDRLIPHLTLWLEKQHAELPRADLMQSFAQQHAQSQITPQAPVPKWQGSRQWLVQTVDLQPGEDQLQLIFKSTTAEKAQVGFNPIQLRQWLGILFHAYTLAEWPKTHWPTWMTDDATGNTSPGVVLH